MVHKLQTAMKKDQKTVLNSWFEQAIFAKTVQKKNIY